MRGLIWAETRRLSYSREARIAAVFAGLVVCTAYYISFPPARDAQRSSLTHTGTNTAAAGEALSPRLAPSVALGIASSMPGVLLAALMTSIAVGSDYQGSWNVLLTKETRRGRVLMAKLLASGFASGVFTVFVVAIYVLMSLVLGSSFQIQTAAIARRYATPPLSWSVLSYIYVTATTIAIVALATIATRSRTAGLLVGVLLVVVDSAVSSLTRALAPITLSGSIDRTFQALDPYLRQSVNARLWPTAVEPLPIGSSVPAPSPWLLCVAAVVVSIAFMAFRRQDLT